MEPHDCFSIPYVIMLDNDIIVWHNEGQNVFAYPTFYIYVLLAYLVSCPG